MDENQLVRVKKAGEGSYGVVYLAANKKDLKEHGKECKTKEDMKKLDMKKFDEDALFAVKKNFKDPKISGYTNLKEGNIMSVLYGHPYIVGLLEICDGDPFTDESLPMTPVNKSNFKYMDPDKMHFVMEYLPFNGDEYMNEKTCTPDALKVLMVQLLLAIEYIHANNIIHRDIRTSNVLISVDEEGNHQLKVCDFGLSKFANDGKSTPGTVTSWYRAPEICCSTKYGKKVDIWAAGAVIYELIAKRALLQNVKDSNIEIFNNILNRLPVAASREDVGEMFINGKKLRIKPIATPIVRKTFVERMNLSKKFKEEFSQVPGSLDQLEDLLQKMLCFNPEKRISATKALNHPFFDWTRGHIKDVRMDFKPVPPPLPFYEIYPCIERKWVTSLIHELHNKSNKIQISTKRNTPVPECYISKNSDDWYNSRLIFHALDLFDRYLEYCLSSDRFSIRSKETEVLGRLHNKESTYLRFYTCLYIMHKYYSTLSIPFDWGDFVPNVFTSHNHRNKAEKFERLMVYNVTNVELYRKTLLEIAFEFVIEVTEENIADCLKKMGNIKEKWLDGSVRALYRNFKGIKPKKR